MTPLTLFGTVAAAHALAVMSPGPDFAMVTRQTLAHGRGAGVRTALGIGSGIAVHVAYALFGFAFLIETLPGLLNLLRLVGAMLLLWIGAQAVRARPQPAADASPADAARPAARDFAIGFVTNVTNVKAMLFFIALCSSVVTAATPTTLKLALGAWMVMATAAWFTLVAVTLGHPRVRTRLARAAHWIDRAMGALLLVLGGAMLLALLREALAASGGGATP